MLQKPREALALSARGTVTASLAAHKSVNAKRNTTCEWHQDSVKIYEFIGMWGFLKGLFLQFSDQVFIMSGY